MIKLRKPLLLLLLLYVAIVGVNLLVNYPAYRSGASWRFSIAFRAW